MGGLGVPGVSRRQEGVRAEQPQSLGTGQAMSWTQTQVSPPGLVSH